MRQMIATGTGSKEMRHKMFNKATQVLLFHIAVPIHIIFILIPIFPFGVWTKLFCRRFPSLTSKHLNKWNHFVMVAWLYKEFIKITKNKIKLKNKGSLQSKQGKCLTPVFRNGMSSYFSYKHTLLCLKVRVEKAF